MASTGSESNEDAVSRMAALEAATKYIDFAKYDKNGDGYISYTELAIVFVCGGEANGHASRFFRDRQDVAGCRTGESGRQLRTRNDQALQRGIGAAPCAADVRAII